MQGIRPKTNRFYKECVQATVVYGVNILLLAWAFIAFILPHISSNQLHAGHSGIWRGADETRRELKKLRDQYAKFDACLSSGRGHTVGLKTDGTVVAVGDNDHGQCNTGRWRDIVAVSAGAQHTIGLKADGTVVAVGNNKDGQCNTNFWRNIVAVSAGGKWGEAHTVGLRADGTVVAVGSNSRGQCNTSEWYDIVAISTGFDHTVGLKKDGTVVAVGANGRGQCDTSTWRDIVTISAACDGVLGLKADGTVVSTGALDGWSDGALEGTHDWRDMIAVSAGGIHTAGLKADGTVVASGGNAIGQCNTGDWRDIVAIYAGGRYTIGLRADGTVVATGFNANGESDTINNTWRNIGPPARTALARTDNVPVSETRPPSPSPEHGGRETIAANITNWMSSKGLGVGEKDKNGKTLAHFAAAEGRVDVLEILHAKDRRSIMVSVRYYGRVSTFGQENGWAPIHFAAFHGQVEVLKWLTEHSVSIDTRAEDSFWLPIHLAAFGGQIAAMEWLQEQGADINARIASRMDGWTPMHRAARGGHVEALKWLKAQGADLYAKAGHMTMMHEAARGGDVETMKWLKGQGLEFPEDIMCYAAMSGRVEAMAWLKGQGVDVDAVQNGNWRSMLHAAVRGHLEAMKWLTDQGADINEATATEGKISMHMAAGNGHLEVLKWLREQGVDINAKDYRGQTPLDDAMGQLVSREENPDQNPIVRWLKNNGARSGQDIREPTRPAPTKPDKDDRDVDEADDNLTVSIQQPSTPPRPAPTRPQPPKPTPPRPTESDKAANERVDVDWSISNYRPYTSGIGVPFSEFCQKLLFIRESPGVYAGIHVGPAVESRHVAAYTAYRTKVKENCESIALDKRNVKESPSIRSKNKDNDKMYDRYELTATVSGKAAKVTVYVGLENGRCVAYWFANPDGPSDLHMSEVGKAKITIRQAR